MKILRAAHSRSPRKAAVATPMQRLQGRTAQSEGCAPSPAGARAMSEAWMVPTRVVPVMVVSTKVPARVVPVRAVLTSVVPNRMVPARKVPVRVVPAR